MINAQIICDSVNIVGDRLTTFVLEYPRFIHAEVLTHRVFSKNSASSRAIPIEKIIQQVIDNPAMPVFWGKNQSGMQANEELSDEKIYARTGHIFPHKTNWTEKEWAQKIWLDARDEAIKYVKQLNELGCHKQIANRILEPWFNIKVILSGTDFGNFFALRAHKDAQPELQELAHLMLDEYNKSKPNLKKPGEWHLPFSDKINKFRLQSLIANYRKLNPHKSHTYTEQELIRKICTARVARISYFNFDGKDDYEADISLCDRLFGSIPKHLSPAEACAEALDKSERIGNFVGWKQFRKFFSDENITDVRIKKCNPKNEN